MPLQPRQTWQGCPRGRPSRGHRGSCQISSEPYLHRFQTCTGTPPDPPKLAAASTGHEPRLTMLCWIITSLFQPFSQMSYAASALVPLDRVHVLGE